jgi:thioredoxin-dependent peroxiredoxin
MEMACLSSYRSKKNVVLCFYPKDDTLGCTVQALEFSGLKDKFAVFDTVILGISRDDCLSHGSFRDKHDLTVCLLSDSKNEASAKYDILRGKEVNGEMKYGILRSTFIIDMHGVLKHVLYGVKARNHAIGFLHLIKELP